MYHAVPHESLRAQCPFSSTINDAPLYRCSSLLRRETCNLSINDQDRPAIYLHRNASIFSGGGIVAWRRVGDVLAGALCNCPWTENPDQAANSNDSSHGG
jgi:hypothetical protein